MACTEAFNCGVIEGFYGHQWTWSARQHYADFLAANHYDFYIYAPKADAYLRSRWQDDWPDSEYRQLKTLAEHYQQRQLGFGIALSPLEIYKNWNLQTERQLIKKLKKINAIGPSILCVLYDDMRGDFADLAALQITITHLAQSYSTATQLIMCPTYYSHEPVLEELFGPRPVDYWQDLGSGLNAAIDIFWTGDKVCSTEYSLDSIKNMNAVFQRRLSLWDNYPVNDGRKTSPFLHVRAFEQRPYGLAEHLKMHVVNPMNAAYLSQVPLQTLSMLYQLKDNYQAHEAQEKALLDNLGADLAHLVAADIPIFQDQGRDELSAAQRQNLFDKYQAFEHPAAQEICKWLDGHYIFDPNCLTG